MKEIRLAKPYVDEEEVEVRQILKSGWVSQGHKVKKFGYKCLEYLGVEYALAVTL